MLEDLIEQESRRHPDTAFAVAVVRDGEIVEECGFGAGPDSRFRSGSISKTLTAVAVLRLVEKGALVLDEPVAKYLPWLAFAEPAYAQGVNLRRLLSHSSGLFGTADMEGPRGPEELARFIREAVPQAAFVAAPGTVFEYSSVGVDLAGCVAEAVTGVPFAQLVAELVFEPLGMEESGYQGGSAADPAANACCSTRDLARLAAALLTRDRRLLRPASVEEMLTPQVALHDGAAGAYGLGLWLLDHSGHAWATHAGLRHPYRCELSLFPESGVGLVFQCDQTNDFDPLAIRNAILEEVLPPAPVATRRAGSTAAPPPSPGSYFSFAAGFAELEEEDGCLALVRHGVRTLFRPAATGYLASEDGAALGSVDGAGFMYDEHFYGPFDRRRVVEVSPALLQELAGTYRFEDGDTACVLPTEEGLVVTLGRLDLEHRCLPLDERTFASDAGLLVFASGVLRYQGFVTARREG